MKQPITEKKLTPNELKKREEVIKKLKANRSSLVKRYGKDAEKVMYGRATNIAKKTAENMNKDKVREMIKKTLMSPVENKDIKDIAKEEVEMAKDAVDTITMDVPLFIRMLEYAREDASTDVDLHDIAEKAIEINKGKETLSMQDYEDIIPALEAPINENKKIGDIVNFNGEKHEVTRVEGDRIYIRPSEPSVILGKKNEFWIKQEDLDEGLPKGFWKKETAELDETFEKLVGKLKKQGKSEKAAKAIAGAVAQYKAKGGGKGPTSKQSARLKEELSDVDTLKKYVSKYTDNTDKEISKYKLAGFQAFSEPVKIGLKSDMDFITWVQMKHDEDQLRREKGI